MIQVKSHKRARKNGVTVVRKHMKKALKKKVSSEVSRYNEKYTDKNFLGNPRNRATAESAYSSHPKTGLIRRTIMDNSSQYAGTHNVGGKKITLKSKKVKRTPGKLKK